MSIFVCSVETSSKVMFSSIRQNELSRLFGSSDLEPKELDIEYMFVWSVQSSSKVIMFSSKWQNGYTLTWPLDLPGPSRQSPRPPPWCPPRWRGCQTPAWCRGCLPPTGPQKPVLCTLWTVQVYSHLARHASHHQQPRGPTQVNSFYRKSEIKQDAVF